MNPPVWSWLTASSELLALVGNPPRIFRNQATDGVVQTDYIVWRVVSGVPENYLAERPDMDSWRVQLDHYSPDEARVLEIARASRDALEPYGHQIAVIADERDRDTGLYRYSFDFEFWTERE